MPMVAFAGGGIGDVNATLGRGDLESWRPDCGRGCSGWHGDDDVVLGSIDRW